MPALPSALITPDDLKAALGPGVYVQIFDDDGDGVVTDDDDAVLLVIERAHAEVVSYALRIWDAMPPGIPPLLKSAELDFAVALAFERHPEYVRAYGEEGRERRWKRASTKMERIAAQAQIVGEGSPDPKTDIEAGGSITIPNPHPLIVDSSDGDYNGGDF